MRLKMKLVIKHIKRVNEALEFLKENSEEYLKPSGLKYYSPKFFKILENMVNPLKRKKVYI